MTENEKKVLRAAGRAQEVTGAAIVIDTLPLQEEKHAFKALDVLKEEGSAPSRIIVAHVDFNNGLDGGYVKALLDRGVYVEFDGSGTERPDYSEWLQKDNSRLLLPTDSERVKLVSELVENGYARNVLLSHDTCMKWEYKTYGGVGYGHIPRTIVPALRNAGVSDSEISSITVENPGRLLAYLK